MRLPILAILITAVITSSGCMCCGTDLTGILKNGGGETTTEEDQTEACESPYIQVGSECCLDDDGNGVCDSDETSDATAAGEETDTTTATEETATTLEEETTTLAEAKATTTTAAAAGATTTTQRTNSIIYNCVKAAGYNPDWAIYLYSKSTGRGCGSDAKTITDIKTAASRSGVEVKFNDITYLDDGEIRMMECFFGRYTQDNLDFTYCPRLMCPKTGDTTIVKGGLVVSEASGFLKKCK